MRVLFFTLLIFFLNTVNSQENTSQTSLTIPKVEPLSAIKLLNKAKPLLKIDQQISIKLANEALLLAKKNNNFPLSAQAHSFLGKAALESKNIEQSLQHFLQASLVYKKIADESNHIFSSIDYIRVLIAKKRYKESDEFIETLLPIAQKSGDEWPIALTLITKSDSYYQQKRYNDAIVQYKKSLKYLSNDDKKIQKQKGEIYKKIAQSYKRLKNREQTIYFYEQTLAVYTALENKKLMARTLNTLAEAERYVGRLVIALDYSIRGLEIHKEINDPVGYAKALVGAGVIYQHISRYKKALKHFHEAHLYYKKIDDVINFAKTSNQLGFIYTRLKQFDEARAFYQLSIDLTERIDPKLRASALREMAVLDLAAGHYESAMLMAKEAYLITKKNNNKFKASISARVIGNIYNAQQENKQAIIYYQEALSLATDINSKIYQIKAQIALAKSLIGINTEEAIERLTLSLALSTEIKNKEQTLYIYRQFRKAEKSRGNIAESLRYAEAEFSLMEVIENEKSKNDVVFTEANYYSYKMEMELESLREKSRLDKLELFKKNNEIEIANQSRKIAELELVKNKYASITLALLLATCVLLVVFFYRRFIVSKRRNRELDYLAARDPLTNCYNRRILLDRMAKDFLDTERLDEYCIIMADIDHFKSVNDTYGHSAGDSVICGVANILQGSVRQNDIVARFGGEEFSIVLHRVPQNQAMHIAETMRKKIERAHFDDITVTCSFGVTSIQFEAPSPEALIEQADIALYKSKSLGRNRVTLWDKSLDNQKKAR